jgi:glucokinase
VPLAIGVDLGATNARAAAVDPATGAIAASHKLRHPDRSPERVAATVVEAVRAAAAAAGIPVPPSIGVGVAGQCLGTTGLVLNAPNLGWRDVRFGELLGRALGTRVRIANDLLAAALGELRFGAARGLADAALVFIGSGIGSGLILGGKPYEGSGGVAGELGHVKVPPRPDVAERRCGCGQLGCLEAYAGGVNLAARVREELEAGRSSSIRDLVHGDLARITPGHVEQACAAGDGYALALWEEVSELVGDAIANLATVLNPARIILGGGVILGCPLLAGQVRRRAEARVVAASGRGLTFAAAALGDDAGVVGASTLE